MTNNASYSWLAHSRWEFMDCPQNGRLSCWLVSVDLRIWKSGSKVSSVLRNGSGTGFHESDKSGESYYHNTLLILYGCLTFQLIMVVVVISNYHSLISHPHYSRSAGEIDTSLRTLTKETYDKYLAEYHPWPVRKAVRLAVYALPSLEELVNLIVEAQPEGSPFRDREKCKAEMLSCALPAMRKTYNCVQTHLAQRNMLNLPWSPNKRQFSRRCHLLRTDSFAGRFMWYLFTT